MKHMLGYYNKDADALNLIVGMDQVCDLSYLFSVLAFFSGKVDC